MNASQIKQMVSANKAHFTGEHGAKKEYEQTTMFVPVATEGHAPIQVQKRQDFMTKGITDWRDFHIYRSLGAMGGLGALLLLPFNPLLSAVAAMAGAWSYGEFVKKDFTLNVLYKRRHLLEST